MLISEVFPRLPLAGASRCVSATRLQRKAITRRGYTTSPPTSVTSGVGMHEIAQLLRHKSITTALLQQAARRRPQAIESGIPPLPAQKSGARY